MKKLFILFLSLFLLSTQANAFALGWLVKKSYERLTPQQKKELKKTFAPKPEPKPKVQKKAK